MKAILLVAVCLMTSLQARPPHSEERSGERTRILKSVSNSQKVALMTEVSAKILETQRMAQQVIYSLGEPYSHTEGMIRATIINQIEALIEEAKVKRNIVSRKDIVTEADIQSIEEIISDIEQRLEELLA